MTPLSHMDQRSRRFYARILNNAFLNFLAVRYGLFDTLLCDTTDPVVYRRWMECLPEVHMRLRQLGII